MNIDWHLVARIVVPLLAVVFGFLLHRWFESKPKIVSYLGHVSAFRLSDANKTQVFSHSIVVYNSGQKPGTNIRIGHAILPNAINIFPTIDYKIVDMPDGSKEIQIPQLVPDEQITISYLYFPPITWDQINKYTKFDEGFAEIIRVFPTPQMQPWKANSLSAILLVGLVSSLYLIVKAFIWAWTVI
jgi:hypothetical protein